jgi:anhydro-N-acetylmuramic acid kinase
MTELFIGLMSGTSLDGVDGVLIDLAANVPRHVAHNHQPFPAALRDELLALNVRGDNELDRAARAANALSKIYADTVAALVAQKPHGSVRAIGCHGQTVRHQPADGYTVQLVNGALLAELTGIDVVCDFRSRDIAAGGEGAPLVPAFHHAVFASSAAHRVIVNIGGIANLTDLPAGGTVTGFDCGPGNMLMDAWIQRHRQLPFDRDGAWAAEGRVLEPLLARLRSDAFFARRPPKSSGRDHFNFAWLERHLERSEEAADVQATLLALTASVIADDIKRECNGATEIYLCGGGARNTALLNALAAGLAPATVTVTDALGVNAEFVEATAFAWLGKRTLEARPGNLPSATGASGKRVLGAIYLARLNR